MAASVGAASELINRALDLQGHSFEWENFNTIASGNPQGKYPDLGEREIILGQSVRLPVRRPNVAVKFRRATLYLSGLPKPIILIDLSGKAIDPITSI